MSSTIGNPEYKAVYFIGIGGIGMSALARYFVSQGYTVRGYDKTETRLTNELKEIGIDIHFTDDIALASKNVSFVVYTPAIPSDHKELNYYKENGYTVIKRSDALQWITENSCNICVSGTHGKTTISTMIAHLLRHSEYGCSAFLGGISNNYNTNFWSDTNNTVVVEADEYDRSFLKLSPDIAIISAMDPDHLDIYGTVEEVENAFIQFSYKIKKSGCLIYKHGMKRQSELNVLQQLSYSLYNKNADVFADNIIVMNGSYRFDIISKDWKIEQVTLNMGGLYNIENVLAAASVAKHLKITNEKIVEAIGAFKGVRRRFEYILKNETHQLIDDYAHHPAELEGLLKSVRNLYPGKKIHMVFQPHLFSRTKDFADEFAKSLDLADEVILLPIYPARELPIPGVTSELILLKMKAELKSIKSEEQLLQWVKLENPSLLVMAGAGDIDKMVYKVRDVFENI